MEASYLSFEHNQPDTCDVNRIIVDAPSGARHVRDLSDGEGLCERTGDGSLKIDLGDGDLLTFSSPNASHPHFFGQAGWRSLPLESVQRQLSLPVKKARAQTLFEKKERVDAGPKDQAEAN